MFPSVINLAFFIWIKINKINKILNLKIKIKSPASTCTRTHVATVNFIVFVAYTTHLTPLWHLSFVRCPWFQIIRKTKREHEVSSGKKPVVQPKAQASEVCTTTTHEKRLKSLSLSQIYRETAFINNKQWGVLQLKHGEKRLVMKNQGLYLQLYKISNTSF